MYWWTFCHGQKALKRLFSNNIKIKATNSVPLVYRIGSFFCTRVIITCLLFMKENPIIVPVQLNQPSSDQRYTDIPSCYFKINGAEATFYNGVDKHAR